MITSLGTYLQEYLDVDLDFVVDMDNPAKSDFSKPIAKDAVAARESTSKSRSKST